MLLAVIILFTTITLAGISIDLSKNQIINLAVSGIIGLVIGDTFLFKAFTMIGTGLSMLLMSLTPAMKAILAYFFLGERIALLVLREWLSHLLELFSLCLIKKKMELHLMGKRIGNFLWNSWRTWSSNRDDLC